MTGGMWHRGLKLSAGLTIFIACMHGVAFYIFQHMDADIFNRDQRTLIITSSSILLSAAAMLSQAMESVTRIFYTRSDLELIITSPARIQRLFFVRLVAIALSGCIMSLVLIGPFIDVLAWYHGARWFSGYGVLLATSLATTAVAIIFTVILFRAIGP